MGHSEEFAVVFKLHFLFLVSSTSFVISSSSITVTMNLITTTKYPSLTTLALFIWSASYHILSVSYHILIFRATGRLGGCDYEKGHFYLWSTTLVGKTSFLNENLTAADVSSSNTRLKFVLPYGNKASFSARKPYFLWPVIQRKLYRRFKCFNNHMANWQLPSHQLQQINIF